MLHFERFSPYSHDAVNLSSLGISLVVVSQPSVDSPIDIHLSQEKRVVGIPGLTRFFYKPRSLCPGSGTTRSRECQ